jgi:uncharacterized protein YcfJ
MKKIVLTLLAAALQFSAPAQLFSPESFGGALWGSLIGGAIGGDCRHGFSGEGAAIGAGAGLLAGAILGETRRQNCYCAQPYVYAPAPSAGYGYGYSPAPFGSPPYAYYAPNSYCAPGYYYQAARPNYAVGGTLLGAASGALIGAGEHRAGEGAAIGAAAGLVLGSVAELTSQKREEPLAVAQAVPARPAYDHAASMQPQPSRPVSRQTDPKPQTRLTKPARTAKGISATQAVFRQIPDAPRVADAPTF